MKTDTIFYQLLQTFPGLIFELLGDSTQKAENYQFSSREIKPTFRTLVVEIKSCSSPCIVRLLAITKNYEVSHSIQRSPA
ncbi:MULTISPECIES: DUF2887 domain-containing protein [unclassified Microcystis]|uniref:DUF2887 domain-containing protein n=1 Tax=unclassified Microcystis TaxID=2643300 RepID=UPI003CD0CFE9